MAADSFTLKFTYVNKTDGDGSEVKTVETIFDAASQAYVKEVQTASIYAGRLYVENGDTVKSNLKFGTSSKAGNLKLVLKEGVKVDSIIFRAAMYGSSEGGDGFSVNGQKFTLSAGNKVFEDKKFSTSATVDTLDILQTKAANGRFYLTSITVFPGENGVDPDPEPEPEPAKNLGEKTIAEFLALKNTKDTCVLTGVVDSIKNTTYGNLYLSDATAQVYVYGVLNAAGEAKKFADLDVEEGDTLTIKALYNEYNNAPQVKNGIFVSVKKAPVAMDTIPTTAPAAPKQAEANVLAVFCNHYATNNVNFGISGWAGAYQILELEGTKVAFWKDMTWECIIDPAHVDSAHDFSAYKNLHVDMWAPAPAKIKFVAEAVAGANYKDGIAVDLKKGWNSFDFATAEWPSAYDFKNVKCFVLEQYQTPAGENFEHNPFAITNIYFWNAAEVETITCAKAAEDALAGKTDEVAVKGYVTEIATAWSSQYKNISFWMADAKDGGKVFQAFRAACEKEADAPIVGDLVVASGKLTKYNETPELAAGCTFEIIEKAPRPEPQPTTVADTITVAKAIELGMALDSMATDTVIYAVEGYVINAGNISMTYKNQIWFMADEATATASDFEAYNCFAIEGNDTLKVLDGDKVQLVGKLKKYYNRNEQKYIIEIEKGNASFISKVEGDHSIKVETEEVTVAKALEIGAALGDNKATEKMYKITAYVSAINVKSSDAYSDQYGNQSFWVADDVNSTASTNADGAFYVYRGKPSTEKEIAVGSKVEFTCTIKKYVPNGGGDPVIENADQNIVITVLAEPAGPELPEGVISCDSAVVLAAQIEDPVEVKSTTTGPEVKVRGYVTYKYNASEKDGKVTQSAWLSDTKGAKSGVIQGAYLEIASMESAVVVGDYVQIEGTLAKYLKEGKDGKPNEVVIEVINGRMCKVGEEGIENVVLTEKAQKVIVDGVLYIIRDNKMYNIQGMQVR